MRPRIQPSRYTDTNAPRYSPIASTMAAIKDPTNLTGNDWVIPLFTSASLPIDRAFLQGTFERRLPVDRPYSRSAKEDE
jgi:hypothetical protein